MQPVNEAWLDLIIATTEQYILWQSTSWQTVSQCTIVLTMWLDWFARIASCATRWACQYEAFWSLERRQQVQTHVWNLSLTLSILSLDFSITPNISNIPVDAIQAHMKSDTSSICQHCCNNCGRLHRLNIEWCSLTLHTYTGSQTHNWSKCSLLWKLQTHIAS